MPKNLVYITEHQARLTAEGSPNKNGTFEIFCITAGLGNGWEFPPEVLQASLPCGSNFHASLITPGPIARSETSQEQ